MIYNYASVGRDIYPEFATDLHPILHSENFVSLADIQQSRQRGKHLVPARDKKGRKLAKIWDEKKTKRAADHFAKVNGWPFMCHVNNVAAPLATELVNYQ